MTLTNTGFAGVAVLVGTYDYIGVGTGTTAAGATDTALETESVATGMTRAIGAVTQVTTTVTNDTSNVVLTMTNSSGGTVAVTEYALFADAAAGIMLDRQVDSAVNVADGNSLQITYKTKVSA